MRGLPASIILSICLVTLFILSLGLGRYPVPAYSVVRILMSHVLGDAKPSVPDTVVIQIRLPRILAAILVGAALSLAGGSFQGLFRNPLVSPDILGVSAGAGFGAALAILLNASQVTIEASAFCFALVAVSLAYVISSIVKANRTLSLILAGLVISSLFSASISLMEYIANPINQLPTIIYWLMGSLASDTISDVYIAAIPHDNRHSYPPAYALAFQCAGNGRRGS